MIFIISKMHKLKHYKYRITRVLNDIYLFYFSKISVPETQRFVLEWHEAFYIVEHALKNSYFLSCLFGHSEHFFFTTISKHVDSEFSNELFRWLGFMSSLLSVRLFVLNMAPFLDLVFQHSRVMQSLEGEIYFTTMYRTF